MYELQLFELFTYLNTSLSLSENEEIWIAKAPVSCSIKCSDCQWYIEIYNAATLLHYFWNLLDTYTLSFYSL